MHCGESSHGFSLLFHTLCTDQVLFPISTDYIFHSKSSITFPVAQGRQAYCAASSSCLCSPPGDLGFEYCWGAQSPPVTALETCPCWLHRADQTMADSSVWSPRCSSTHPGFILAHHGATRLHFIFFSLYIFIYLSI